MNPHDDRFDGPDPTTCIVCEQPAPGRKVAMKCRPARWLFCGEDYCQALKRATVAKLRRGLSLEEADPRRSTMYVVVLANSQQEAHAHAKKHSLPLGRWRYATRAASIRGLRVSEVHMLSTFGKRMDKHSILAELRYTKGDRKAFDPDDELIDGEETATPEPSEDAAPAPEVVESNLDPVEVSVKRRKPPAKPASLDEQIARANAAAAAKGLGGLF